jgi:hypothetical protein
MKWRLFAGIAAILVATSALAGLIDEGLSAEEAHQIKRLAIVSGLGDVIHGRLFGSASIPLRALDLALACSLVRECQKSSRTMLNGGQARQNVA